ncbi:MAG: YraN family protein [Melioribacteraceae bacterium]|nr:YraN family protein [Melioribacteraceae bacterium]
MRDQQNKRKKGKEGEELASNFLKSMGYEIIEMNYQFGHGEIDIIAKDKNEIVFVEVKTRKSLQFGSPEYAFTKAKINQVKKIAQAYLIENNLVNNSARIDAIAILIVKDCEPIINHYKNITG